MTLYLRKRLSHDYIHNLKSPENISISDKEIPGFRLRYSTKTGSKTFYFWFRTASTKKSYNIRLGKYPELKVKEARDQANEFRVMIRRGENPVQQQRKKELDFQKEEESRIRLKVVLQQYLDEYAKVHKKPKTYNTDLSTAKNYLFPKLGELYIKEVTIRHLNKLVSEVGEKSKTQANKCKALMSHFMNWCEDMEYRDLNTNPCKRVKKFKIEGKDRVLSFEEYSRFFSACRKGEELGNYSPYVFKLFKFLAFSGCRPSEIRLLTFGEIDFDYSKLRLKDSKTGKREVAIGNEALDILRELYKELYKDNPKDYVFPASIRKGTPLFDLRRPWDYVRNEAKLPDVTPYTLRHSYATLANALGENTATVKELLGHSNISTTEKYIHPSSDVEIKAANRITNTLKSILDTKIKNKNPAQDNNFHNIDKFQYTGEINAANF